MPRSLLSYFTASKSRAAACERLLLDKPEDDVVTPYGDDLANWPFTCDADVMKLDERLNVLSGRQKCINGENGLPSDVRTTEASTTEDAEQEKDPLRKNMRTDDERRRLEADLQNELKKLMETEMRHQKEVEMMEKRAQEKLEQEFQFQKELISSLQRRVEEERRKNEEEQRRIRDEQERRRKEEVEMRKRAERRRLEEEVRRKEQMRRQEESRREEERRMREMECKRAEEERAEETRKMERKREEERVWTDWKKKRQKDEMRRKESAAASRREEEEFRKRKESGVKSENMHVKVCEEMMKHERKKEKQNKVKSDKRKPQGQNDSEEREEKEERGKERRGNTEDMEENRIKDGQDLRRNEEELVMMEAARGRKEEETPRKVEKDRITKKVGLAEEEEKDGGKSSSQQGEQQLLEERNKRRSTEEETNMLIRMEEGKQSGVNVMDEKKEETEMIEEEAGENKREDEMEKEENEPGRTARMEVDRMETETTEVERGKNDDVEILDEKMQTGVKCKQGKIKGAVEVMEMEERVEEAADVAEISQEIVKKNTEVVDEREDEGMIKKEPNDGEGEEEQTSEKEEHKAEKGEEKRRKKDEEDRHRQEKEDIEKATRERIQEDAYRSEEMERKREEERKMKYIELEKEGQEEKEEMRREEAQEMNTEEEQRQSDLENLRLEDEMRIAEEENEKRKKEADGRMEEEEEASRHEVERDQVVLQGGPFEEGKMEDKRKNDKFSEEAEPDWRNIKEKSDEREDEEASEENKKEEGKERLGDEEDKRKREEGEVEIRMEEEMRRGDEKRKDKMMKEEEMRKDEMMRREEKKIKEEKEEETRKEEMMREEENEKEEMRREEEKIKEEKKEEEMMRREEEKRTEEMMRREEENEKEEMWRQEEKIKKEKEEEKRKEEMMRKEEKRKEEMMRREARRKEELRKEEMWKKEEMRRKEELRRRDEIKKKEEEEERRRKEKKDEERRKLEVENKRLEDQMRVMQEETWRMERELQRLKQEEDVRRRRETEREKSPLGKVLEEPRTVGERGNEETKRDKNNEKRQNVERGEREESEEEEESKTREGDEVTKREKKELERQEDESRRDDCRPPEEDEKTGDERKTESRENVKTRHEGGKLRKSSEEERMKECREINTEHQTEEEEKSSVVMSSNEDGNEKASALKGCGLNQNTEDSDGKIIQTPNSSATWSSSHPDAEPSESPIRPVQFRLLHHHPGRSYHRPPGGASSVSCGLPVWLPERSEQKRLCWMRDCVPWSKLALHSKRKQGQGGAVQGRRGPRAAAAAAALPPLCPDTLLHFTGWSSLSEMTSVTLEDLPGCSLSTLAECAQLRFLSLRRCGLTALESINQLQQLAYVDVQENEISFVDCENMQSLRVLKLSRNKLTCIHGLAGAENLDVLELSHNSITRIAGLQSARKLQRLAVDHNELISTGGLRDVYTLLHLSCSHNHLSSVEGVESSALLATLDLRANSLMEPPRLDNQVLLRELRLDDNSISSLDGLAACWLPLLEHLSVAQNRITQLPPMSDFVSLANLDLQFNCVSEIQNVCESLQGCHLLQEVHLMGNPLQQDTNWRSRLQGAALNLRTIDDQNARSSPSPPAGRQFSVAPGSFAALCQAQLHQTRQLQQRHSRRLSDAFTSMDVVKTCCQSFSEALQLATDQRYAHEYGDTAVAQELQTRGENALGPAIEKLIDCQEVFAGRAAPRARSRNGVRGSGRASEPKAVIAEEEKESRSQDAPGGTDFGDSLFSAKKRKSLSSALRRTPVIDYEDLQGAASVVVLQPRRERGGKSGNVVRSLAAEKGDHVDSGPGERSARERAATVIQARWRGVSLRRRLVAALAAVTWPDLEEEEEEELLEELDTDGFTFDEDELERQWMLPVAEDSSPGRSPTSEQGGSLKAGRTSPEQQQQQRFLPPPPWSSKQAWMNAGESDSAEQTDPLLISHRSKSPASASVMSGFSKHSERILEEWGFTQRHTALLMLKRARKMKSKKQQKKKKEFVAPALPVESCGTQLSRVKAPRRQKQCNMNYITVGEAALGLQQAEGTEQRAKQERTRQWLHSQAAQTDSDSESAPFLPEIDSQILNGGPVQLVAGRGHAERPNQAGGSSWASGSGGAVPPTKRNARPQRDSPARTRENLPSPKQTTSSPSSRSERISFRDKPVLWSGGWGGGKKRGKVHK
ncbi:uncharacterized protein lrriq1 isoform X2 [Nelusetta ayraudi]